MNNLDKTIKQKIDFKHHRNRFSIMNEGDMNDILNINQLLESSCGIGIKIDKKVED